MTETFIALLLAHALADFVLQTRWMVDNKRRPAAMLAHGGVVLATAVAATGSVNPSLLALAAAHLAIDAAKTFSGRNGLAPFLIDQAAHLASLGLVAIWAPDLWAQGPWATWPVLPAVALILAGLVLTIRAGGFAVGFLMAPWAAQAPQGLLNGGRMIGTLERGLIFLLMLTGQPEGIGLLIAAKSVLRFGAVKDDLQASEYVIIGTLASFGWAIGVSALTLFGLQHGLGLGIPDLSP